MQNCTRVIQITKVACIQQKVEKNKKRKKRYIIYKKGEMKRERGLDLIFLYIQLLDMLVICCCALHCSGLVAF